MSWKSLPILQELLLWEGSSRTVRQYIRELISEKVKIEEVRALVYAMDATGIICDDELSPAQLNNLEQ